MNNNKNINSNAEQLLASGKMGPLIARYAVPGAVGLVFFSLQAIVDGIIVGNYLDADALAGVSLMTPAYTLLTALALIIGIGTQAQMSIGMGQQDYDKSKSALKSGLLFLSSFAILFSMIINSFPRMVASVLGSEGVLLDYSTDYIRGVMPFMLPNACFYFFDYVLKALGHPRFSMIVMVSSVLLNIVLSILFAAVLGMGTFGVGLATGLSMLTGCILSGYVALKQLRSHTNLSKSKAHFSWRLLGRIFYNGSSEGVSEIAMGITLFLFNITLLQYAGKEGVAAFSIINYIIFIGTSILLGISDGTVPVISYNYGANLWDRIKQALKIVYRTNLVIGLVFISVLWIFGESIVSLFLDESSVTVAEMAANGARIMGFAFLLNGFNIFTSSFFTALDNAKWSLLIAGMRGFVFIAIGINVWPLLLGVTGIWITIPIAELFTALVGALLLRRIFRKRALAGADNQKIQHSGFMKKVV